MTLFYFHPSKKPYFDDYISNLIVHEFFCLITRYGKSQSPVNLVWIFFHGKFKNCESNEFGNESIDIEVSWSPACCCKRLATCLNMKTHEIIVISSHWSHNLPQNILFAQTTYDAKQNLVVQCVCSAQSSDMQQCSFMILSECCHFIILVRFAAIFRDFSNSKFHRKFKKIY